MDELVGRVGWGQVRSVAVRDEVQGKDRQLRASLTDKVEDNVVCSSGEPGKVLSLELTVVTEVEELEIDPEIAHIIQRREESSEERGLQVVLSDQAQRGQGRRVEDGPDPRSMRAEAPFRRGPHQITTNGHVEVLKFEVTLDPVGEAEVGVASTKDSSALRRRTSPHLAFSGSVAMLANRRWRAMWERSDRLDMDSKSHVMITPAPLDRLM